MQLTRGIISGLRTENEFVEDGKKDLVSRGSICKSTRTQGKTVWTWVSQIKELSSATCIQLIFIRILVSFKE